MVTMVVESVQMGHSMSPAGTHNKHPTEGLINHLSIQNQKKKQSPAQSCIFCIIHSCQTPTMWPNGVAQLSPHCLQARRYQKNYYSILWRCRTLQECLRWTFYRNDLRFHTHMYKKELLDWETLQHWGPMGCTAWIWQIQDQVRPCEWASKFIQLQQIFFLTFTCIVIFSRCDMNPWGTVTTPVKFIENMVLCRSSRSSSNGPVQSSSHAKNQEIE